VDPIVNQELPPVATRVADPAVTQLQADLAEQRRITQQIQSQIQQPRQQNNPTSMDELNRQFFKEPITTAAAIAQQAANEAIARHGQNGQETLVLLARDKARERNPELFDKYATEIEQRVKTTVDPQFHSNVNVWLSSLNMSIGEHVAEIREAARQLDPAKQAPAVKVSEGGPAIPNGAQPNAPKGAASGLTAEELTMAKNLDISADDYAAGKKFYEGQNKKGPSSWDDVVTFSSKDMRRKERAKRTAARLAAAK
jgi:hypothetical protein